MIPESAALMIRYSMARPISSPSSLGEGDRPKEGGGASTAITAGPSTIESSFDGPLPERVRRGIKKGPPVRRRAAQLIGPIGPIGRKACQIRHKPAIAHNG